MKLDSGDFLLCQHIGGVLLNLLNVERKSQLKNLIAPQKISYINIIILVSHVIISYFFGLCGQLIGVT